MVKLHQDEFRSEKKDSLTRIFDFVMYIIGSIYNKLSMIPMDILTELHLKFYKINRVADKKILGYWDFNQRLGKLGDFMVFLETLSMIRFEFNLPHNKKNIDVCFIDDKNHYNSNVLKFSKTYRFKKLLSSLVIINPCIDSVFFFSSNGEFDKFYFDNKNRYLRWPPTVSGTASYDVRLIDKIYKKTGKLTKFEIPTEILNEIYGFYQSNVFPSLPIVVNVRKNIRQSEKNSNVNMMKSFFKKYEKNKDYKFIIICNKDEIFEEFRELKNVIFSKDHFSDIEYDLALVKTAHLSIFPCSGMSSFAWYADVPFILNDSYGKDPYATPPSTNVSYFSKYQIYTKEKETIELLISQFENLVKYLKEDKINNTLKNKVLNDQKYLSKF